MLKHPNWRPRSAYTLERGYRVKLSGETYSFFDAGPSGHHVALSGHVGVVGSFGPEATLLSGGG